MNRETTHINVRQAAVLLGALGLLAMGSASAQVPVDDNGNPIAAIGNDDDLATSAAPEGLLLSAAALEELVGPVALYPDDLLAVVLPASTFPLEIVQAARYLERHKVDPSLQPDDDWDESIIALLNYPEVVNMMNDDLDWTWKLGEAVIAQQNELIVAVEAFRDRAFAAGNLKTDAYQTVSNIDGVIEIEPVNDDVIYVPYYEPERVVVYSTSPVYYYYPHAYPVYYYPYAAGHSFNSGFFWGVTTAFSIGWATDYLHVYHHSYYGHPYYGHSYYYGNHYWRQPSIHVYNNHYVNHNHHRSHDYDRHGDYWRPRHHGGARPGHQVARNTYYSGSQRPNTQNSYRDGRTDGLAYNSNTLSSRSTTTNRTQRNRNARRASNAGASQFVAANRNWTRSTGVSPRASTPRPAVRFRQRSENTYTGSVLPRLERTACNATRQSSRQTTVARNNTRSSNSDTIRFRARESSANRSRVNANATARQSRRTSSSARTTPTNQMAFTANKSPPTTRNTSRRSPAASSSPQVRRSAPARVSSAPRSQPRQKSVSRPASPPRQARQSSVSRSSSPQPSSQSRSAPRSKVQARSSGQSGGQSRSSRIRK